MPHIHEKIDYAVDVFVVYEGRVLLRKHDKYGIWLAVGGHIELDEDPNQAAIREVKEEVGLDIELADTRLIKQDTRERRDLIAPVGMNRHRISDTHEHISMFFFASSRSDAVVPEKADDEWKWCKEEEIDILPGIPADVAYYAKLALDYFQK